MYLLKPKNKIKCKREKKRKEIVLIRTFKNYDVQ